MKRITLLLILLLPVQCLNAIGLFDLRCEMLHQPWGIDNTTPALSW